MGGLASSDLIAMLLGLSLAFYIAISAGIWGIFAKAGAAKGPALIPFYNVFVFLKAMNRPGWWIIFFLVPGLNLVIAALVSRDLAKAFGKDDRTAVAIFLLPFIFFPLLGFGEDKWGGASE